MVLIMENNSETHQVDMRPESPVTTMTKSDQTAVDGDGSRVEFVSREEWGARNPLIITPLQPPLSGVIVHHSAMACCKTKEECVAEMKIIQDLHMDTNGWDDIGYNFLVGEDGRVYEGRGWDNQGAHTKYFNSANYGICIMGNFMERLPSDKAFTALKHIIDLGVKQGKISEEFAVFGHRDARHTTGCPGEMLYERILTLTNYGHDKNIPKY